MVVGAIEWSQGVQDAWSKVATFLPKLFGFLVVLVVGLFVAKAVRRILQRVLAAAKLDAAVDRTGFGQALRRNGFGEPSALIVKVAYAGLVLLVLQLAIGALGPNPVADAFNSMMAFIPKIVVAIAIVFVTGLVAEKVGDVVRQVTARQSYGGGLTKAAVASIWLIGGFAALDQVQIARDVVDTLFRTIVASLGAVFVIKFGVGGVWAARDRFWPRVYDALGAPVVSGSATPGEPTSR